MCGGPLLLQVVEPKGLNNRLLHGDIDARKAGASVVGSGDLRAAVVFHLHDGGDRVPAVVVELIVLLEQLLRLIRQIKGVVIGQRLDTERLANLYHRVKRGTADAVVQCAVDGGQKTAARSYTAVKSQCVRF